MLTNEILNKNNNCTSSFLNKEMLKYNDNTFFYLEKEQYFNTNYHDFDIEGVIYIKDTDVKLLRIEDERYEIVSDEDEIKLTNFVYELVNEMLFKRHLDDLNYDNFDFDIHFINDNKDLYIYYRTELTYNYRLQKVS